MEGTDPTYQELKDLCKRLRAQISHFAAVEQDLIHAKGSLERELIRYKIIQSYSEKALLAGSLENLARITVEAIKEAFEVDCAALFEYDRGEKRLKPVWATGF